MAEILMTELYQGEVREMKVQPPTRIRRLSLMGWGCVKGGSVV